MDEHSMEQKATCQDRAAARKPVEHLLLPEWDPYLPDPLVPPQASVFHHA